MSDHSVLIRRVLAVSVVTILASSCLVYAMRLPLTEAVFASALRMAGAGEIQLSVSHSSPWRVVLDDVAFRVMAQNFAAKRVTMDRRHWWMPSLGSVKIEEAVVPVTIDGSDTNPWAWATYEGKTTEVERTLALPVDEISVDGKLMIRAAMLSEQALTVRLQAKMSAQDSWDGALQVEGPGLSLEGTGNFEPKSGRLEFKVPAVALDVRIWQDFMQRLVILPGGRWEVAGKLTGSFEGRVTGKDVKVFARAQLREGHVVYPEQSITASGVEADLFFDDVWSVHAPAGQKLRITEIKIGELPVQNLDMGFSIESLEKISVAGATFQALGGQISAEPFSFFPNLREIEATLAVDGIDIAQVLGLAKDVPAQATGRVNGRVPIRLDASGLRFGTGWLALKPGVYAEVQFKANGILTGGIDPKNPRYAVLKKIEGGLLRLKVGEMRLDVRPPNSPPGRSATLRVTGEPVDPTVKAPVTLDLNVNGPIERLINLGLDSRTMVGMPKK